jgi:hypothetical protein
MTLVLSSGSAPPINLGQPNRTDQGATVGELNPITLRLVVLYLNLYTRASLYISRSSNTKWQGYHMIVRLRLSL